MAEKPSTTLSADRDKQPAPSGTPSRPGRADVKTKVPYTGAAPAKSRAHRLSAGPVKPPRQRLSWRQRAALLAVPVVIAGALTLSALNGPAARHAVKAAASAPAKTTAKTPGDVWNDAVIGTDLQPLTGVVLGLDTTLDSIRAGKTPVSSAIDAVNHALPDMVLARENLAKRAPFPQAPQALEDYRTTVNLYIEGARMAAEAAAMPSQLQTEVDKASQRVRDIGDRLVDQAKVIMTPYLTSTTSSGVTTVPPADVSDWSSLQLGVGPPLDTMGPVDKVPQYVADRPTQPLASWVSAVQALQLPTAGAEASAITSGSTATDRAMAEKFDAAVTALNADADPAVGGRVASVAQRLGLQVDSEALRAAEAATIVSSLSAVSADELRTSAQTLALIGDQLWNPQLGAHATGFDASLLTRGTSTQSGPYSNH